MLIPDKHMNPDKSVLAVSGIILKKISKVRVSTYEDLLELVKKTNSSTEVLFIPAISLLFLLGIIEYHPKTDSFEYVGP